MTYIYTSCIRNSKSSAQSSLVACLAYKDNK